MCGGDRLNHNLEEAVPFRERLPARGVIEGPSAHLLVSVADLVDVWILRRPFEHGLPPSMRTVAVRRLSVFVGSVPSY